MSGIDIYTKIFSSTIKGSINDKKNKEKNKVNCESFQNIGSVLNFIFHILLLLQMIHCYGIVTFELLYIKCRFKSRFKFIFVPYFDDQQ